MVPQVYHVPDIHRYLQYASVGAGCLLCIRVIDPVCQWGVLPIVVVDWCSFNTTVICITASSLVFYTTLEAGYAVNNIHLRKAELIIRAIFITVFLISFILANLCVLLRVWIVHRFWNDGLFLLSVATSLIFILIMFDMGVYYLYRAVCSLHRHSTTSVVAISGNISSAMQKLLKTAVGAHIAILTTIIWALIESSSQVHQSGDFVVSEDYVLTDWVALYVHILVLFIFVWYAWTPGTWFWIQFSSEMILLHTIVPSSIESPSQRSSGSASKQWLVLEASSSRAANLELETNERAQDSVIN